MFVAQRKRRIVVGEMALVLKNAEGRPQFALALRAGERKQIAAVRALHPPSVGGNRAPAGITFQLGHFFKVSGDSCQGTVVRGQLSGDSCQGTVVRGQFTRLVLSPEP